MVKESLSLVLKDMMRIFKHHFQFGIVFKRLILCFVRDLNIIKVISNSAVFSIVPFLQIRFRSIPTKKNTKKNKTKLNGKMLYNRSILCSICCPKCTQIKSKISILTSYKIKWLLCILCIFAACAFPFSRCCGWKTHHLVL